MYANVVIAIGSDDTLPAILAHIHQAGLGDNALLLRPRRTSIQRQLERANIPTAHMPSRVDEAEAALLVHAAARSGIAADITRRHGASATWIVAPDGTWDLIDDDIISTEMTPMTGRISLPAVLTGETGAPDETTDI